MFGGIFRNPSLKSGYDLKAETPWTRAMGVRSSIPLRLFSKDGDSSPKFQQWKIPVFLWPADLPPLPNVHLSITPHADYSFWWEDFLWRLCPDQLQEYTSTACYPWGNGDTSTRGLSWSETYALWFNSFLSMFINVYFLLLKVLEFTASIKQLIHLFPPRRQNIKRVSCDNLPL